MTLDKTPTPNSPTLSTEEEGSLSPSGIKARKIIGAIVCKVKNHPVTEEMQDFLDEEGIDNDDLKKIIPFLIWRAEQHGLGSCYEAEDIFSDTCERAIKVFTSLFEIGQEVGNYAFLLKEIGFNVIREKRREYNKQEKAKNNLQEEFTSSAIISFDVDVKHRIDILDKLDDGFRKLSDEDQEILTLFWFENKSWKEIEEYYFNKYPSSIRVSQATLRKRKQRAQERLQDACKECVT